MPTNLDKHWNDIVLACKERIVKDNTANIIDVISSLNLPQGTIDDINIIEKKIITDPVYKSEKRGDYIFVSKDIHYKKPRFRDNHPFITEIIITVIAAGLSLLVQWLLTQTQNQTQYQLDKRQDSTIQDLRDSLYEIQILLSDTTTKK